MSMINLLGPGRINLLGRGRRRRRKAAHGLYGPAPINFLGRAGRRRRRGSAHGLRGDAGCRKANGQLKRGCTILNGVARRVR